jgi:hypothetical protein
MTQYTQWLSISLAVPIRCEPIFVTFHIEPTE